jgi:OOP family OmpA-OmpF porin
MWFSRKRHRIGLLVVASLALAAPSHPACAQADAPVSNLVDQLIGPDTPADTDVAALRQRAADRIQSKADATALRRPPIAPQLLELPHFDFDVVFDPDSSLIRPQSYQTIGRIADALADLRLLPYNFLVIDHTEATGRRDANLTLSQRRADSIRTVLARGFGISSKRLQALGLGEEQLQDSGRPTSSANARAQIVPIGKVPAPVSSPPVSSDAPANKGSSTVRRKRR